MISSNTSDTQSSSTPTPQSSQDVSNTPTDEEQQKLNELIAKLSEMTFKDSEIPALVQKVHSDKSEDLHHGLIGLRKLLSRESEPPLQQVIDTGVVPRLIQLIPVSAVKKIQLEAAWCLTNLCSGDTEQTRYVIQNGAISSFIYLLSSDDAEVIEQSVWGLGNIAGDNSQFRDMILQQNGTEAIVKVLVKAANINLKRNGAWALANLCRGKPEPKFDLVSPAISTLCEYLNNETDAATLTDVAWALSYIAAIDAGVQGILSQNIVPKIIELLSHKEIPIQTSCLRILGNIISGTDEQASVVLKEKNFISELFRLAEHPKKPIRREVFWILSNITAGTPVMFEVIMGNPAYVEKLIKAAKNDVPDVKKEALWALSNSTSSCTPAQIIRLLDNGVFACLVEIIGVEQDPKVLCVALEGIKNCLKWGEQFNIKDESGINKFVAEMESNGGLDKIEVLQTHQNNEVYELALEILETYFVGEEEEV